VPLALSPVPGRLHRPAPGLLNRVLGFLLFLSGVVCDGVVASHRECSRGACKREGWCASWC